MTLRKAYLSLPYNVIIYSATLHKQDVAHGQFFRQSLIGLNSEFFFS